jgi:hypothetical protein
MHLLWLKIYTPAVDLLPAVASNTAFARDERSRTSITSRSDDAFEPMIPSDACLEDMGEAQHVAPWATMSVRHLQAESIAKTAGKSVSGELRSGHVGTTSSLEVL